jgi:hypothetical protein
MEKRKEYDAEKLANLLAKVNRATGPMTSQQVEECIRLSPWYDDKERPSHDPIWSDFCKALYGSIDAAVALAERTVAINGRKLICFFCAGGQLTPENAEPGSLDYHPLAKVDNSVTVGWLAHVAFYNADGSCSGPERYSHGATASLAILAALFSTLPNTQGKA